MPQHFWPVEPESGKRTGTTIHQEGKTIVKVIGAGFGRTGTLSLKGALEQLGFGPCYHMLELFEHPEHVELWEAAARGAAINWDELFHDYNATVDWPACTFYEQLMQAYPDAKVVLTVRDPERWYESTSNTIYRMRRITGASPIRSALFTIVGVFAPDRRRSVRMINTIIWQGTFGGRFEDKEHAIAIFERHIAQVKERVPAEKLLVYDVKEGWEPLCRFLNVAVPEGRAFPHLNDTNAFRQMTQRRMAHTLARPIAAGALVALVWLLFWQLYRRIIHFETHMIRPALGEWGWFFRSRP
jgi:hypothetical protein